MGRIVRVAIVIAWLALVGVLVRERWTAPPPVEPAAAPGTIREGDEWLDVYHQDQKIGYVHQSATPIDGGYQFEEHALLRLTVMDAPQTVRTITSGRTGADFALRQFSFELSSGVGGLRVQGRVVDGVLQLTLATGSDTSTQRIPLSGPVYLPATLSNLVATGDLREGQQRRVQVFDPSVMKNATMEITVERREPVPKASPEQRAWRVREEFRGIRTTAWIDDRGTVLREEGPMNMVLVRSDANRAVHAGWSRGTALDLVQTVAVPVARLIEQPRGLQQLRVRLRGIDLDQVPSDARQRRDGDTWTITREDLSAVRSYTLPYSASDRSADLAATPLLQINHPRVRAAATEALGDERDALRAIRRLLAWIHGYMRQAPTVSIPNAIQVLDERQGDCNEHAVLFAALARAVGLPTRVVAGVVYLDGAFYYHAWDEVWLDRWVAVDPVFDQFPADPTHIKFIQGGPEEQFAILQVIGRLRIDVLSGSAKDAG